MSDGEEGESLSREIDPAIWAVAPRLHQEEGPIDVTASPAFQCLDEVSTVCSWRFAKFCVKSNLCINAERVEVFLVMVSVLSKLACVSRNFICQNSRCNKA